MLRVADDCEAHTDRHVVLVDACFHLRSNILVLLTHEASTCLLSFLDEPLFLYLFFDLLLLHFHDNVLAGLFVSDEDFGPHIHLEFLFGDVANRIP